MATLSENVVPRLATAAAAGDERAWAALVQRLDPLVRGVLRGYRLSAADAEDVVQTTWLHAFRHLPKLREPAAFPKWLTVTARREALRALQRGGRELLLEEPRPVREEAPVTIEQQVIDRECKDAIAAAVARLPQRQRSLLGAILRKPGVSYDELSVELSMPMGSIGPTRERALRRLRDDSALLLAVS
jgi:RNA polymerase sigma factor (sigma-70 family)